MKWIGTRCSLTVLPLQAITSDLWPLSALRWNSKSGLAPLVQEEDKRREGESKWPILQTCPKTHRRTAPRLSCGYADARECKKMNFNHQKSPITAQQPAMNLSPRDAFQKWQRRFGEASTRSSPWHTPPSWTHPDSRRIYSGCLLITRRLLSFPTGLKEPDAQILIRDWSAILAAIIWRRVTVLSAAARHGGRMEFVLINMGLVRGGCAVGN